jgi:hypothetical protein
MKLYGRTISGLKTMPASGRHLYLKPRHDISCAISAGHIMRYRHDEGIVLDNE